MHIMQCTATLHEQADTDDDEDLFRSFRSTTVKRARVETETERYLSDIFTAEELKMDPIEFWTKRAVSYPNLSAYALKVLIIPASSCLIEEVFSQCGLMLTSRRNSVLPEKAHQNMFLKINNDL